MKKSKNSLAVVLGLGQFGTEVATILARRCEVLAIDQQESRVDDIADLVHRALCLDVRDFHALASAVDADFDVAVIAMSENMEASILAALHLRKLGVKTIYAKAVSDDHAAILKAVGVEHIIFPERETGRRIASLIMNPNLLDLMPLAEGFEVRDLAPPDEFVGKTLMDLHLPRTHGVFILAIKELVPERLSLLPTGDFVIKDSDILVVVGREADVEKLTRRTS